MQFKRFVSFGLALALMVGLAVTPIAQDTVQVLGGFNAAENYDQAVADFADAAQINYSASDVESLGSVVVQRVRAGNPPDLYVTPQPGLISNLVANDAGVPLVESGVFSQEELNNKFSEAELALGQSADGTQHALPIRSSLKSAIWYNPKMFDKFGYEIPKTWDELIALSDQIVADGMTPWCHALESGSASGWPGTDFIEDIVLHKEGPKVYDKWVNGEVNFSDPRIKEAFQMYLNVVRTEGYTFGGPTNAVSTPFGEVGNGIFPDEGEEAPNCFMFKQATFILSFVKDNNEGVKFGENIDFFDFPTINPEYSNTVMGAGVLMGMLNQSEGSTELMRYAATPEFQVDFAKTNNNVARNNNVKINEENYPNPVARQAAQSIEGGDAVFRFDGSDSMPTQVGSGSFWTAILDLVQGAELEPVLKKLDEDFEAATQ
ncbi:MAG: ABC transporter substrate-binding protein [Candidatus Bipolaricaulia bacterium]